MAYSADSFVADEVPTTAKWNKLWTNDASFNDGTGIGDDTIDSRHYVGASVDGEHLSSNAVLLGFATTTSSQGSITGSETDLTNLSVAVTVPSGGRSVKITSSLWPSTTSAGDLIRTFIKEGSTYLGFHSMKLPDATAGLNQVFSAFVSAPSAGAHTYKLACYRQSGSGTITSNAGAYSASNTQPFILVELI